MQIAQPRTGPSARDDILADEELVQKVLAGETAMFELLMRRNNQRVYRAVRGIVRDETEAEDVMQQAYVSAYQYLAQFSGHARFSTWLTRIAVNEALRRKRRGARLVALDSSQETSAMSPLPASSSSPEDHSAARELLALVEAAIDELPEAFRTVFLLREVEGMDTSETASVLEVSEDVVKTRLSRAKASLRERLASRVGSATLAVFQIGNSRCDRIVAGTLSRLSVLGQSRPER
jgi:RNA polymerase sigma-70 factor (ECF subfamily)